MIGEFKEARRDERGDLCVTFIVDDDTNLDKLEKLKGSDLLIKYEKFSGSKTSKQNRYFWELMKNISKYLHLKQWTCYLMILSDYGVWTDIYIDPEAEDTLRDSLGENYRLIKKGKGDSLDGKIQLRCYKGLHLYNKQESKHLIECAQYEAEKLGLETLPPYELKNLFR